MQSQNDQYISRRVAVPSEFKEVFSHFYVAHNKGDESIRKTLFPSYKPILVFNFGKTSFTSPSQQKAITIGKCLVLGPVKKAFEYTLGDHTELFVVNFKDDGFHRFFSQAMVDNHEWVHPDELVEENCFSNLWKQLISLESAEERAAYLIEFCRPYLEKEDKTIRKIMDFSNQTSVDPIKVVADEFDQSKRNVQLKHKKHLGYSAKAYARYRRFLKTITFLQQRIESAGKHIDWIAVVEQNGYYDQPHLIRDFKHYLDITPSQYLALHRDVCIARPSEEA